jgi:hypothetical protein
MAGQLVCLAPGPDDRVGYLKQLVDQGGFNRYAYEGVEAPP